MCSRQGPYARLCPLISSDNPHLVICRIVTSKLPLRQDAGRAYCDRTGHVSCDVATTRAISVNNLQHNLTLRLPACDKAWQMIYSSATRLTAHPWRLSCLEIKTPICPLSIAIIVSAGVTRTGLLGDYTFYPPLPTNYPFRAKDSLEKNNNHSYNYVKHARGAYKVNGVLLPS